MGTSIFKKILVDCTSGHHGTIKRDQFFTKYGIGC